MNHYCTERLAIFSHYQKPTSSSWETVIRISDPDFNPDHAQLWTRSSYDHYLPTHQISSKSDQSFLRNPANKQTNKQTNRQTDTRRWLQYPAFRGIMRAYLHNGGWHNTFTNSGATMNSSSLSPSYTPSSTRSMRDPLGPLAASVSSWPVLHGNFLLKSSVVDDWDYSNTPRSESSINWRSSGSEGGTNWSPDEMICQKQSFENTQRYRHEQHFREIHYAPIAKIKRFQGLREPKRLINPWAVKPQANPRLKGNVCRANAFFCQTWENETEMGLKYASG